MPDLTPDRILQQHEVTRPARERSAARAPPRRERFVAMCNHMSEGKTVLQAFLAVSGPGGTWPLPKYVLEQDGGLGHMISPRIIELQFNRMIQDYRPDMIDRAQVSALTVLSKNAVAAANTVVGLANGDFRKYENTNVSRDGIEYQAVDTKMAAISLNAANSVLGAVGVQSRGSPGHSQPAGVNVQVVGGEGGSQVVTVFGALKLLGARAQSSSQSATTRSVPAEVTDAE